MIAANNTQTADRIVKTNIEEVNAILAASNAFNTASPLDEDNIIIAMCERSIEIFKDKIQEEEAFRRPSISVYDAVIEFRHVKVKTEAKNADNSETLLGKRTQPPSEIEQPATKRERIEALKIRKRYLACNVTKSEIGVRTTWHEGK